MFNADAMARDMALTTSKVMKASKEQLADDMYERGEISKEILADVKIRLAVEYSERVDVILDMRHKGCAE